MRKGPAVVLLIVFSVCVLAQGRACSQVEARQADEAVDSLNSWDRLYWWYKTYRHCDDGVMAEGYSEAVTRNLVDRWKTLPRLGELARNDAGFRRFVLRHVNQTVDDNDLKKISANAADHCPSGLNRLCRELKEQAAVQ